MWWATREAREETGLKARLLRQFHTYSDPGRDPRHHTATTVFIAAADGSLQAGDDAGRAGIFSEHDLPDLVFDHARIINDYFDFKKKGT